MKASVWSQVEHVENKILVGSESFSCPLLPGQPVRQKRAPRLAFKKGAAWSERFNCSDAVLSRSLHGTGAPERARSLHRLTALAKPAKMFWIHLNPFLVLLAQSVSNLKRFQFRAGFCSLGSCYCSERGYLHFLAGCVRCIFGITVPFSLSFILPNIHKKSLGN